MENYKEKRGELQGEEIRTGYSEQQNISCSYLFSL